MLGIKFKAILISVLLVISQISCEEPAAQNFEFTAEVSRLMDILINSLYTQKEVFLREVISNASDALDKIRFESLKNSSVLGDNKDLEIRIQIDDKAKSIRIKDTGVGMTRQDLINNLGTIAKSGTTNFLEALKGGDINLIGQFGVGFYSTFMAGSRVKVTSKSNNDDQYIWTSDASASFTIEKDPQGNTLGRGTLVQIFLKADSYTFLKHRKLERIVKKHSEFIDFPIYLNNLKEVQEEEKVPQETEQEQKKQEDDVEMKQKDSDEEKKQPEKKKRTYYQWQQMNENKALWLREKDQIYEEDYIQFFKSLTKQSNPPMNWIHFTTEGEVIFTTILYIPNFAPYNFYSQYSLYKNQLKLYVRRVLISEKNAELVPRYLSFVRGVIDSDELPLKVSRQTLQQTKAFKVINQKITKKILDMITQITKWQDINEFDIDDEIEDEQKASMTESQLEDKQEEIKQKLLEENKKKYKLFYEQFGKALKLGVIEDKVNRKKLASLTRWYSTRDINQLISFDDYIKEMKPIQDQIYFFSGQSRAILLKSPLVVGLVLKGYEVILCDDPIDEYVFNTLREYQSKNIVNVGKGDFKMPEDDEQERKKIKFISKKFQPYADYAKKLLYQQVSDIAISSRLTKEPCVVISDTYGYSSFMDKVHKAQMFTDIDENPTSNMKKIMQINPHHKVNQIILQKINNNQKDQELEDLVSLLYNTAALSSGYTAKDTNQFITNFFKVYSKALGVINTQRKEIPMTEEVELQDSDFENDGDIIRLNPGDFTTSKEDDDE